MPRRPNVIPSIGIHLMLPEDIYTKLTLFLHSDLEGRVPKGAYQRLFIKLINDFFHSRRLDLQPFGLPQGYHVTGPKEMIEALETKLKETHA